MVRRRSTNEIRTSMRPSAARRAETSPQIFCARTSELAVMICMSLSTSLSCPTTAALDCKAGTRSFCNAAKFPCPWTSAETLSICRLSSACSSPRLAVTSLRSSARAAATSSRMPALTTSTRELSSLRNSEPKLRMRAKSSVASRPSAAERSERSAPASALRFSPPPVAANSKTRSEPAPLLTVSLSSPRYAELLLVSSSRTARSEANALERSWEFSTGASPAIAEVTLRASSEKAVRSFSTSVRRNLRSAFSSSLRSAWLIWCRSESLLRASRSVSKWPTRFPILCSSSSMELCKNSVVVRSSISASVTLSWRRRSSTSVFRALHSASK
mmetsp:Transcript_124054/g.362112  ORF Transcript_124054/g.362112 Transcript_124054/m.362112 type:complete len:330 (+) Transcript_124054:997-1986(+)